MKKTNPVFSLKNFRSFGADGADFELAPITVLTGCNSAGKSSLVKALMLLSAQPYGGKCILSDSDIEGYLPAFDLTFSEKELMLGRFDKVLHDNSDGKEISFSYRIWSDFLQEVVVVERLFVSNHSDKLNNGHLLKLTISKTDGTPIYETKVYSQLPYDEKDNFCAIEENYKRFLYAFNYYYLKKYSSVLKDHIESEKDTNKIEEYTKWLEIWAQKRKKAGDILRKQDIQADSYSNENLRKWESEYTSSPLSGENPQKKFFKDRRTKEEQEDAKRGSFICLIINEIIRPWFIERGIVYINSSSALINRLYSVEDENKICRAIKKWNERSVYYRNEDSIRDYQGYEYYKPGTFLNKWVKVFNLGDSVELEGTSEGLGFLLYLVKDGEKRLLADEGYGITQLVSLLLQIDNRIKLVSKNKDREVDNFILPDWAKEPEELPIVICVEEPEVHLHPKYQSLLADMFVEAYQKHNIHFIIETHSEYLIRKLQVMVADKESTLASDDVSLNYVEKDEEGISHNRQIKILEDGSLSDSFGSGFYDEADALAIQLFRNKPILS